MRIAIKQPGKDQVTVSTKTFPLLAQINRYLEAKKFSPDEAQLDPEFRQLFDRLCQELKKDYFLPYYKAIERVELKKRQFNFEESLNDFEDYKNRHSIGHAYRRYVERFWLPFFLNKKACQHPRDFIEFALEAEDYLRTKKNKFDRFYSPAAYNSMTTPLNEYLRYLLKVRIIDDRQCFAIDPGLTLEERKRRIRKPVRNTDTHTTAELMKIKDKIDETYSHNLTWKLRAYGIFLGSYCLGLRVGNVLGMPVKNLRPDDGVPHAQLKDNVVSGWSRGLKGSLRIEDATKTGHDENVKVPFLLPDKDLCIEVARFIKANKKPDEALVECSCSVISRWWRRIAKKCHFKYIHPHGGKHGLATIGAANMHLFNNNPYLLQYCCLHKDFRTTQKYINQKSDEVLKQFAKV